MRALFLIPVMALLLSACVSVPSQCHSLSDHDRHHYGSGDLRASCARAEIAEDYQDTMLLLLGADLLLGLMSEPTY